MTEVHRISPLDTELAALAERRDALRQATRIRGVKLRPVVDAALAELDAAIDALAAAHDSGEHGGDRDAAGASALHAERRLLRAMFTDAPVPLFPLEHDGTVRRVNRAAGEFLDTGTGYATGKPFTAFVSLPSRAAVHTQLAATIRTGAARRVRCELLTSGGARECELDASLVRLRGDADKLMIAVTQPGSAAGRAARKQGPGVAQGPGADPGAAEPAAEPAPGAEVARAVPVIAAITRRLDLVTAVTRHLLENATQNEAVTLQRCASLLAGELAAWVIVDTARDGRLRRQLVIGPEDQRSADLAREAAAIGPQPGTVPHAVHETGSSQLIAHAENPGALGEGPGGEPLLMLLNATSVLSVPVSDGERAYGVVTLARRTGEGPFELADLGLVEELGEQLALAIKVDRMVRQRTETTAALRASLLPPQLPSLPGVEIATLHLAAGDPEVGGDFYDAYRCAAGWGVSIGDVGGRGKDVAAVGAAARHAIRVISHSAPDPAAVLTGANDILLAEEFGGRFVTTCAAQLEWRDGALALTLACAGHPGPVLVHPDGQTQQMRGGGLPLGIFPDADVATEEHELSPSDVLVFFTDGLVDTRNPERGYFGDMLAGEIAAGAGLRPQQVIERLRAAALEFCNGELRDDVTVLVLAVREPPATPW